MFPSHTASRRTSITLIAFAPSRQSWLFFSGPHACMARMKSVNAFLIVRYIVFGLFTMCNAIICSVAVWNHSLIHLSRPLPIDVYLIFVGAFALLSVFTLIFIELLCVNPVTTRVWFECVWIAFFWTMELAGGAALIAIGSNTSCASGDRPSIHTICTSGRLLLAFTWICTIILFFYLLVLVFIAGSRHNGASHIWSSDVRVLRATAMPQWPSSPPGSPLSTRFKKRADVDVYTPRPVRARPPQFLQDHGFGVTTDYEIEPFRPVFAPPAHMDVSLSHLPEAIPLPPSVTVPIAASYMKPAPPLLELSQFDRPRELASSITYAHPGAPSEPVTRQSSTLPSSSPLGDWPRPDIMKQPAKPKRKSPPPSAQNRHIATVASSDRAPGTCDSSTVTPHRPRRPSGPRSRVPSMESVHRPAPLDLSGISNYATRRHDGAGVNG